MVGKEIFDEEVTAEGWKTAEDLERKIKKR